MKPTTVPTKDIGPVREKRRPSAEVKIIPEDLIEKSIKKNLEIKE